MTARAFLIRGLLAGLVAGLAAFTVAYFVGEPQVQTAIDIEVAAVPAEEPVAEDGHVHTDSHGEGGPVVSRHNQRTGGLLTGSLSVGVALGGLVALVAAGVLGRLGRLTPGQSTAVVSLIPALVVPANPPAVGSGATIGDRTSYYFLFVLLSLVMAVAATALATRVWERAGTYAAVVSGVGCYLAAMIVAGQLMPTVNEVGDFPADTLWFFRRASALTLTATWAVIGVALSGLVGRLHQQTAAVTARRELAASL